MLSSGGLATHLRREVTILLLVNLFFIMMFSTMYIYNNGTECGEGTPRQYLSTVVTILLLRTIL